MSAEETSNQKRLRLQLRKAVRRAMVSMPGMWWTLSKLKPAAAEFVAGAFDQGELLKAVEFNRGKALVEHRYNEDDEEREWRITSRGANKALEEAI